jgi:Protein of unknown function (DUF2807).
MKKLFFSIVMIAAALGARAQQTAPAAAEKSEWLPAFTRIEASGAFDVVFERVPDSEAPKIVYDTKGSYTTKFRAEVKDRVLHIRERIDSRRPERTQVRVCYNTLSSFALTDAKASLADTLRQSLLDVALSGGASLEGALEVQDLDMSVSDKASALLGGSARYLTLQVSGGQVNAAELETMSARVSAQSNAEVRVWVTDRLEARTSTGAVLRYRGEPAIVRTALKFMGGEIKPLE